VINKVSGYTVEKVVRIQVKLYSKQKCQNLSGAQPFPRTCTDIIRLLQQQSGAMEAKDEDQDAFMEIPSPISSYRSLLSPSSIYFYAR
jgi:hypothetical protein